MVASGRDGGVGDARVDRDWGGSLCSRSISDLAVAIISPTFKSIGLGDAAGVDTSGRDGGVGSAQVDRDWGVST